MLKPGVAIIIFLKYRPFGVVYYFSNNKFSISSLGDLNSNIQKAPEASLETPFLN